MSIKHVLKHYLSNYKLKIFGPAIIIILPHFHFIYKIIVYKLYMCIREMPAYLVYICFKSM